MPVVNETVYHVDTPHEVIRVLESARQSKRRVRLHYGDVATGRDWLDSYYTRGTIGRSTGISKIPLLLLTAKSSGGGAVLDHCIVLIRDVKTGRILYKHPSYHVGNVQLSKVDHEYPYLVSRDGEAIARFAKYEQAVRFLKELGLTVTTGKPPMYSKDETFVDAL